MCILCNNYGRNLADLKPPDSVQRPRVSRYGLKTLICIFWNSSAVLYDRVSEMSLMATPYAKYHRLTTVARQDIGKLWAFTFGRKCSYAHVKSKKNYFSTLTCYACCHSPYSSNTATNDLHSFRSLQCFLAEKYEMTSRR